MNYITLKGTAHVINVTNQRRQTEEKTEFRNIINADASKTESDVITNIR